MTAAACGGDDAGTGEGCPGGSNCTPTSIGSSPGSDDGTTAPGTDEGSTTATADSTGAAASTGAVDSSGGGPDGACDPPMSVFHVVPPAHGQASISIDFAAMGCAVHGDTQTDPQLVFDVRDSGLVDVTGQGLEITMSTHGQLFTDAPMGDSQVIDVMPDLETTMTATRTGGAEQVTVTFTIYSTGPTLIDVSAVFG